MNKSACQSVLVTVQDRKKTKEVIEEKEEGSKRLYACLASTVLVGLYLSRIPSLSLAYSGTGELC